MGSKLLWVVAAAGALLALLIFDGFRRLQGTTSLLKLRRRQPDQSVGKWLLGDLQVRRIQTGLPGLQISCNKSSAAVQNWTADTPPPLLADGVSHLYGLLGPSLTATIFPDICVRPSPVDIAAPVEVVWDVLLDFEAYGQWNPFHSRVDVVEQEDGAVALQMQVQMGGLLGELISTEVVWYVDATRHIIAYGIGRDGPSSLRVVYMEPLGERHTRFHSWDAIGGYPALFSRGYIEGLVMRGFTAQHRAIRDRVDHIVNSRSRD